jgi:Protein of unknown function (DUF664).
MRDGGRMHAKDILIDAYSRIQEEVHAAVGGLSPDVLNARPSDDANSVSWLVWHLTRVQDDHVADAAGLEQVWLAQDWEKRVRARSAAPGHRVRAQLREGRQGAGRLR